MRQDAQSFSDQERSEIESLYQVANRKWQTQEARDSLKTLVEKYKKANRTGCAILYLGQLSRGDEQIAYLKQAIADHSDCFYGDGVQVGAFARLLLGQSISETETPIGQRRSSTRFGKITQTPSIIAVTRWSQSCPWTKAGQNHQRRRLQK